MNIKEISRDLSEAIVGGRTETVQYTHVIDLAETRHHPSYPLEDHVREAMRYNIMSTLPTNGIRVDKRTVMRYCTTIGGPVAIACTAWNQWMDQYAGFINRRFMEKE